MIAAAALVLLVFTASVSLARAEDRTMRRIGANVPKIKRWGGWVLIVVGAWLLALAVFSGFFSRLFPV